MKFKEGVVAICVGLIMITLGACDDNDPVIPPDTDDDDEFSFVVQVRDTLGNPIDGLRISMHHLISIDIITGPFRPLTRIQLATPISSRVTVEVFRFDGRQINTIMDGMLPAGEHEVTWNGQDDDGQVALDGIYEIRMTARSDEDEILYTHSEMCDLLKGVDAAQGVLGYSNPLGRLTWTDRQNFPGTYDLPPLYFTQDSHAHQDTFTVLDSVMVTLTDTLLHESARHKVMIINGRNEFQFTFIPDRFKGIALGKIPAGSPEASSRTLSDPGVPTEFRLFTPHPNPFN